MERVEALAADLPGEGHLAAPLDVTDPQSCDDFVSQAASRLGRLDVLVNNAGLALGRTTILEADDISDPTTAWRASPGESRNGAPRSPKKKPHLRSDTYPSGAHGATPGCMN